MALTNLTIPKLRYSSILAKHAPVRRYHVWQTPEARVAPRAQRPLLPRWLAGSLKKLLGPSLYARCKSLAMGALTRR
jgi:hypothetical protein